MSRLKYHSGLVKTAGLVIARQKPPTAKGFAFWLLEDNIERLQVVISPDIWHENRIVLRDAQILMVEGQLYKENNAWTIKANIIWKLTNRAHKLPIIQALKNN